MYLVPDSTICLYSGVDIDMNSGIQVSFNSRAHQDAYFASKLVRSNVNCHMVKKSGLLRIEAPGTTVKNCNYISFINPSFDNKKIYARITDYEFVNNGGVDPTVDITYVIDFWQSWMFDVDFESCHIDREHLSVADWNKAEINPYDQSILEFLTPESELACNSTLEKNYYDSDDVFILDGDPNNGFATYMGYLIVTSTTNMDYIDAEHSDAQTAPSTQFKNMFSFILDEGVAEIGFVYTNDFTASAITGGASGSANSMIKFSKSFETNSAITSVFDYTKVHGFNNALISNTTDGTSTLGNSFNIYWVGRRNAQKIVNLYTQFGIASSILSIVEIPFIYFASMFEITTGTSGVYQEHLKETMKTSYSRVNANNKFNASMRKLYTFPFSYMRAVATNNDVKEYHYEDFKDVADGGSDCNFGISMTPIGSTEISCRPLGYKHAYNTQDNLYLRDIPQAPYTTDSFLTYLASVAQSIIANNTLDKQDMIGMGEINVKQKKFGILGDLASGVGTTAGGLATGNAGAVSSGVSTLFGTTFSKGQADLARSMQNRAAYSQSDAYQILAGRNIGYDSEGANKPNVVYENYEATKPAYAMNLYKGASTGYSAYNKSTTFYPHITLIHVQLRDEIMNKYNDFFKCYGYNSGRFGIPRVVQYVLGVSDNDKVPHWIQVDGKDSTYIKTADMHVTSSILPVSVAIEGMFNGGVRMLRGESLYS